MDRHIRFNNRYAWHTPYGYEDGRQRANSDQTPARHSPQMNRFDGLQRAPVREVGGLPTAQSRVCRAARIPVRQVPVIWQKQLVQDSSADLTSLGVAGRLGQGGMGAVHLLSSPSGKLFAGKESTSSPGYLEHEFEAMRLIYGVDSSVPENIILTYGMADLGFPGQGLKRLLLMERIDGKDGHDLIKIIAKGGFSDAEKVDVVKYVIKTLLLVVQRAKKAGVVHCDLKPDNFMFDGKTGTLKVIDWGGWGPAGGKPWAGTPGYEAPESIGRHSETVRWEQPVNVNYIVPETVEERKKGIKRFFSKKKSSRIIYRSFVRTEIRHLSASVIVERSVDDRSDVYSIGVILGEMIRKFNLPERVGASLYRKMTVKDRGNRISVEQALKDHFIHSMGEPAKARAKAAVTRALAQPRG